MNPKSPLILILTNPQDLHSFLVAEALVLKGASATLWHTADFPTSQSASLSVSRQGSYWEVTGSELQLGDRAPDVVWFRRPTAAVLPEDLHPADRAFALHECQAFMQSLWQQIAPSAFWINPPLGAIRASSKPAQLKAALRAGMEIPATLFSNEPQRIREFIQRQANGSIYKPFTPANWKSSEGFASLFTSQITAADLPDDDLLRITPGIFQEKLDKSFELRVTMIGNHCFTAKLLSQQTASGRLDWRAAFDDIQTEEYALPPDTERQCAQVMADLGLVFGCFDFVVTPERRHVFLEVNEMGQFLWLDSLRPELPMLDAFCELLLQARPDFERRTSDRVIRLTDVAEQAFHQWKNLAPTRHVTPPAGSSMWEEDDETTSTPS